MREDDGGNPLEAYQSAPAGPGRGGRAWGDGPRPGNVRGAGGGIGRAARPASGEQDAARRGYRA